MKIKPLFLLLFIALLAGTAVSQTNHLQLLAQETPKLSWTTLQQLINADRQTSRNNPQAYDTPLDLTLCQEGKASDYPCKNIDLLSQLTLDDLDAEDGNDIWGWTDPASGKEFALIGLNNGLAFVDISNPLDPLYLGKLPPHTVNSIWRDVKIYRDYAFIVSEAPAHGLQIFDLKQLLNVSTPPLTFKETEHYDQFGSAHNIAINEDSGYAYVVGSSDSCSNSGGLHMIEIQNPAAPTFAGCFNDDGYTHDTQCVNYNGPDPQYQGNELCFNANEDTLTIVDVTDKKNPVQLARKGYPGASYAHQGWLTEDHTYFLLGDELDEYYNGNNSRTFIWDISDLVNPKVIGTYTAPVPAIDHNIYIHKGLVYEANYRSGLRIFDAAQIPAGNLVEIAYFDTYPSNNSANFNGAWSVYPFFESGNIVVSDIERGLFVLKHSSAPPTNTPTPTGTPSPTHTPTPIPPETLRLQYLPMIQ